jgi:hypothetical protein
MAVDKLRVIVWLFVATLVSGLCMIFAGKVLHVPLALVHKLLAVLCLVVLLRNAGVLRTFDAPQALPAAIIVFAVAILAAFVTGAVQSIPACASSLWLNLHRIASAIAAIGCAVAARLIAIAVRT